MEYAKPPLTLEEQADLLVRRGLHAQRDELIRRLSSVNYFRLSGYLYPFRAAGGDDFQPGTTVEEVWERYCSLYAARNLCAHHARFWNRELGYQPKLPNRNKFPAWHGSTKPPTHRCGIILLISRHWLRLISPSSRWSDRVERLLADYPRIPLAEMGLTAGWTSHPVWKA